jgi:hypothetical protein
LNLILIFRRDPLPPLPFLPLVWFACLAGCLNPLPGLPRGGTPTAGQPKWTRPLCKVFVSGTLKTAATDSMLHLMAISISPHYPRGFRLLAGGPLSLDYGPPLELGPLRPGARFSVAVDVIGYPDLAYVNSDFGARGRLKKVFWIAPP